ncbi:MAG TPA: AAA family ATPase [Vicinamibacterales bacterium]|nr:AAA family ATPase [Vicinamibacterales bacterium]
MASESDQFRDDALEQVILGDVLLHPDHASTYVESGARLEHFYHAVHTDTWRAILSLLAENVEPDLPAVARRLREHGRDVQPAWLTRLPDGVPKQSIENMQAAVRRLETLRLCRAWDRDDQYFRRQLSANPSAIINGFVPHQIASLEALSDRATRHHRLLDDVTVLTLPDPGWLVESRIPSDSVGVLFGEAGAGKTFLAIDLALAIVSGLPWLGAAVPEALRGPIVYVTPEGSHGLGQRIAAAKIGRDLQAFDDVPLGLYIWPDAVTLLSDEAVSEFIGIARPIRPRLVILDTLARCMVGGDENSARDMGLAVAGVDRIRRSTGATVLAVHHATKAGTSERGSSALRGASDFMLELVRLDDRLTLSCSKAKDAPPFPAIDLRLVPPIEGVPSCVVRLASEASERTAGDLSPTQRRVLNALRECFGAAGATSAEWEGALTGLPRATYFRARKELIERHGLVRKAGNRFVLGVSNAA